MVKHINNKKKLKTLFFLSLILTLIYCYLSFFDKSIFTINYLTNDETEIDNLNSQKLNFVYGAPHYDDYDSYSFIDSKFIKDERYLIGTNDPINENYVNKLLALKDDFNTYDDLRLKYGQISLAVSFESFDILVFDGFLLSSKNYTHKLTYIFKINENEIIEEYSFPTENLLFFSNINYFEENIYLVGNYDNYNNEEKLHETILYKVNSEEQERFIISSNKSQVNYMNYNIIEDILFMSEFDNHKNETLILYDLKNNILIDNQNIADYFNTMRNNIFSQLIPYKDELLAIRKNDSKEYIEILKINYDEDINITSNILIKEIEKGNLFKIIADNLSDSIYLFIRNSTNNTLVYKYNFTQDKLYNIMEFAYDENIGLFLYDIQI